MHHGPVGERRTRPVRRTRAAGSSRGPGRSGDSSRRTDRRPPTPIARSPAPRREPSPRSRRRSPRGTSGGSAAARRARARWREQRATTAKERRRRSIAAVRPERPAGRRRRPARAAPRSGLSRRCRVRRGGRCGASAWRRRRSPFSVTSASLFRSSKGSPVARARPRLTAALKPSASGLRSQWWARPDWLRRSTAGSVEPSSTTMISSGVVQRESAARHRAARSARLCTGMMTEIGDKEAGGPGSASRRSQQGRRAGRRVRGSRSHSVGRLRAKLRLGKLSQTICFRP